MFTSTASEIIDQMETENIAQRGEQLTTDFLSMINNFHSEKQPYDLELEAYIHKIKYEAILNPPSKGLKKRGVHYFHPSSASSCLRELYHMAKGDKPDDDTIQPHQKRWQKLGGMFGDMIQHDLLAIHKHYQKMTGNEPTFIPVYTDMETKSGDVIKVPMWEEFAKTYGVYSGVPIGGQPDGILQYRDGSKIGLEIKSKQTSSARTSQFSMRGPDFDHVKQVVAYSIMYQVDEFLLLYGNLSKKSWEMSDEDQAKYPDLRCFHVYVTEKDRKELLEKFNMVIEWVKNGSPPKLDIHKWTFNNYKKVIARSMARDEIREIEDEEINLGLQPKTKSNQSLLSKYEMILNYIEKIRQGKGSL
ncbi:hypothetical protein SAMN05444392_11918 [Seinonella peptonophila]|uniref:Uncharacterized protein n=1 Tax=Seinonella peptonophila TaxID=112248 RepID=A0A1M5B7C1_9BACL|nr:hypothetical protein [Seinonella peptonophila]SHF38441.1 hypothetical protein SAMN05444392_11918 [Seinonella peptonophila]